MDKFEQFFKENRLRLDSADFENSGWERIATTYKQYNRRKMLRQFYIAASMIAIITLGTLLYLTQSKQNDVSGRTAVLDGVASYYKDEEITTIKLINGTEDEIRKQSIPVEYEDMFKDFIKQLQLIDKQYDIYKTSIAEYGYSQELIQQVIYNYQLKLSVLQMLQSEIDKINRLTKNIKNENKKIQFSF